MAIPILNHLNVKGNINLNDYKLNDFVVDHSTQANAGTVEGKLIYDSGTLKFYDGSSWQSLGTSTGDITRVNITAGDGLSGDVDTTSGDHTQTIDVEAAQTVITSIYNTSLKLGRSSSTEYIDFATDNVIKLIANGGEARWNGSAFVPGTDGAKDLGSSTKEWQDLYIDGTANIDALTLTSGTTVTTILDEDDLSTDSDTALATQQSIKAYVDGSVLSLIDEDDMSSDSATRPPSQQSVKAFVEGGAGFTAEKIQDVVGAMFTGNTETRITATYQDSDGTIDLVVNDMTANDDVNVNVANLTARLPQITESVTIGDATDVTVTTSGNLVVTGDLTVSGDTVSANVATLNVEDKNITLNQSSGDSSSTANGAGLTIQDAVDASTDATLLWDATNDEFDFSHKITAPSFAGSLILDGNTISGIDDSGEFTNDDNHIMTSAAVEDKILGYGYTTDANVTHRPITAGGNTLANGETLAFTAGSNVTITESGGAVTIASTDTNTNTQLDTAAALIDVSAMAGNSTASFTHSLGSKNLIVQLHDTTSGEVVYADIDHTSNNAISVTFANTGTELVALGVGDIRVVVIDAKNGLSDKTVTYS